MIRLNDVYTERFSVIWPCLKLPSEGRSTTLLGTRKSCTMNCRRSEALANKPVSAVCLEPCGTDKAAITGEVMAEFTPDGLAALIEALHMISPQVFVARADRPASPASPEVLTRR